MPLQDLVAGRGDEAVARVGGFGVADVEVVLGRIEVAGHAQVVTGGLMHVCRRLSPLWAVRDLPASSGRWRSSTEGRDGARGARPLRCRRGLSLIHISEPTRLGMISYAVFCLKK